MSRSATRQRRARPELLAVEIGRGIPGQLGGGGGDLQTLEPDLLRRRLRDGHAEPDPIAHDGRDVLRQQARRRLDSAIEGEAERIGERDPDRRTGAREALGVDPEIALPAVERPVAGQRQGESPGRGIAGERREKPAALLRLHRQIEGRRLQLQRGVELALAVG